MKLSKITMPERIQRKRSPGWKMPSGTVYVGRGSIYGNPYKVGDFVYEDMTKPDGRGRVYISRKKEHCGFEPITNGRAVMLYKKFILPRIPIAKIQELRGKNLACWCKQGDLCHADVLINLANEGR